MSTSEQSTGIGALDRLIGRLRTGDNVVWRVDRIGDYQPFCRAIAAAGLDAGQRAIYFRFAQHPPLFGEGAGVTVVPVAADEGFEHFITTIHRVITEAGSEAVLIFDSLSDLSARYYSDRMIGNFFQLTCPFVLATGSVAYFSLDRYFHSYHTVEPVTNTTQLLIDVYAFDSARYVQPVKTDRRREEATFVLYRLDDQDQLTPITASADIARIVNARPWPGLRSASYRMVGVWDRAFMTAETREREIAAGILPPSEAEKEKERLLALIVSREERVIQLARRYLTLAEIIAIWKRMIGTGFIGGKAVGMLLAHAILRKADAKWSERLEEHDSFFVGSDVYYTFLVVNDVWWERQRQKDPEAFLEPKAAPKILTGQFPDYIVERFKDMLDYFGRSPIIVRSSSLLEDNFGNAFAGKYDSVFCTNQGTPEERLAELLNAVRTVYASSVSDEALQYRKARGLLDQDEQMGLLIQRVSGSPCGRSLFFPHLAGVAFSFNPYTWHRDIDPTAGVVRLVFGLGTRAVDSADDDYTRVVALNVPEKRPEADFAEVKRHAQRRVDLLEMESRTLTNRHFVDLLRESDDLPLRLVATLDRDLVRDRRVDRRVAWVLTFDRLLSKTPFVSEMRELLATLREAYGTNVDVEFTCNVIDADSDHYRINVVQCRPLQIHGVEIRPTPLPELAPHQIVMRTRGGVVGHSRVTPLAHVVYVRPAGYVGLPEQRRYELAAALGRITHHETLADGPIMLVGPGRWGTSTPSLGVPARFAEIERVAVLVEIDEIHSGLVADLSLGTHFFNELVELNLLYLAHVASHPDSSFDTAFFEDHASRTAELGDEVAPWAEVVRVITPTRRLLLNADGQAQVAVVYWE